MSTVKRSGGDEGSSGSCIKKLKQEIDDITECAICTETLSNARMLSCCHLFCHECLKRFCENKVEGDDISCPVCRRHSQIPSGGVEKFPLCHFINKLIDVNKLTDKNSNQSSDGFCSPCLAIGRQKTAVGYCFECREDLCESCVQRHKVMNISKSHKIVDLDSKPEAKQLLKSAVSFCQEHPDLKVNFYCNDCKTVSCFACNMVKHKDHVYSDIKDKSQIVTSILDSHCELVTKCIAEAEGALSDAEGTQRDIEKEMEDSQSKISARYEHLKKLLDSDYDQLMNEMAERKMKYRRELGELKEQLNCELICMKSFQKFWSELKECGSACDIAQAGNSLQDTVEELIGEHDMKYKERKQRARTQQCLTDISNSPKDLTFKVPYLLGRIKDYDRSQDNGDTDSLSQSDSNEASDRYSQMGSDVSDQVEEEQDQQTMSRFDQEDNHEARAEMVHDQESSLSNESGPTPVVMTRSRGRARPANSTVSFPSEHQSSVETRGPGAPAQSGADSTPSAPASSASHPGSVALVSDQDVEVEKEDNRQHCCVKCGKTFSFMSYLSMHIKAVHGEKKYKCSLCEFSATTSAVVKKHNDCVHLNLKPYRCLLCDFRGFNNSQLEKHTRVVHDQLKPYKCSACDKKFSYSGDHNRHYQSVHGGASYSCEQCEHKFSQKSSLTRHQRFVHEGVKNFPCAECGRKFSNKSHLKQHWKSVHLGERHYKCNECKKSFSLKQHLRRHVTTVHEGVKPHTCTECGKNFSLKCNLLRHGKACRTETE